MALVLDTTVVIDCLRGRPAEERLKAEARAGERIFSTPITVEEVARGLLPAEEEEGANFFDGIEVIRLGRSHGWQAGAWRRKFSREGVTLSQADCLIASAAYSIGARLATGNPDHFPMKEVRVEHWPVGK